MAENQSSRHQTAFSILALLIILALVTVFLINFLSKTEDTVVEILRDDYRVYITGLAALFVVVFWLYFWAYRKILTVLTVVAITGFIVGPQLMENGPVQLAQDIELPTPVEPDPMDPEPLPDPQTETEAPAETEAVQKPVGQVQLLKQPVGKYHLIIASSIDGDLMMDYAQKLASQGRDVAVIYPQKGAYYYRLAIESEYIYDETEYKRDLLQEDFGDDIWIMKY